MRTLMAVLIAVVLLSAAISKDRPDPPTVAEDSVTIREVRPGSLVDRPIDAIEGAIASVFVVDRDSSQLRRVRVEYGRVSAPMIHIARGLSPGDRIIVSDMRAWDAFDRLQLSHVGFRSRKSVHGDTVFD